MRINQRIAKKVIEVLNDRSGFDSWWWNIDDDIQEEIEQELMIEIEKILGEGDKDSER